MGSSAESVVRSEVLEQARARSASRFELFAELAKARLTTLVLLTTAAGFWLASPGPLDWVLFAWTLLGTALCAFGVNALNQVIEADRDRRMRRTAQRPLPSGQLSRREAIAFGIVATLAGPLLLLTLVDPLTAILGAACQFIYLGLYTPMKLRSSTNTLVGAICGALPPMMGWSAASGGLSAGAWILGAILFVWQIPHFLALAWMYRDDYERGGFQMLPARDPHGARTCQFILVYCATLVPVSLMLVLVGAVGTLYAVGAALLGLAMFAAALQLARDMSDAHARHLFLASVIYLPLLLGLMALDRQPRTYEMSAKPAAGLPRFAPQSESNSAPRTVPRPDPGAAPASATPRPTRGAD